MLQRLRFAFLGFDWQLFGGVVTVLGISLATLYSVGLGREAGDLGVFQKQLVVSIIGLVGLITLSFVNYHTWQVTSRWLYGGTIVLLVGTLLFGQVINGTRGWIGLGPFVFQTVELAKVIAIVALAGYFARHARELDRLTSLLNSLVLVGLFVLLVFFQPDFGSAMLLLFLWGGLVLTIGVKRQYVIGGALVGFAAFAFAWLFLFAPYQKERLRTFVDPSADRAASYNVRQSTIAVGAGGLMGRGFGQGSQSQLRFLPEAETDFIFAAVGEELGFAGVTVLFSLIALIYYRLFRLLQRTQDWFASFVILGTIILVAVEILINAGMAMGMFPVVGIPFPLLSAGGSSLLMHLLLFGIVEGIARQEAGRGYQISRLSAA